MVVAVASRSAAAAAAKKQCPRCASRVEPFAVDTNCTFSMCANIDCVWPFDSAAMGGCFEQDAAVPSIRKLAKKRKALASREERRTRRRQSTAQQPLRTGPAAAQHASAAPAVAAASGTNPLSDWLAGLCSTAAPAEGSVGLLGDYLRLPENPDAAGSLLMSQGNYPYAQPRDAGADWLDSLLAGTSGVAASTQVVSSTAGLTPTSLGAANAGGSAAPTAGNVTAANVADLLAALTSAGAPSGTAAAAAAARSFTEDAVIPHATRHPSPSTSNTESGADTDTAHRPLSPADLERLIGSSKPVPPVCVKAHSTDASYLDSLTMLLSPPHSASPATATDAPPTKQVALDLLDPQFWASHSGPAHSLSLPATSSPIGAAKPADAAASHTASFDLSDLFSVPKTNATTAPPSASAASVASPIDAISIIENIFGSQPKLTTDSL
ncbi:hypothetical protein H4R19_000591 [Coemansia spiralis]|nr:hypothetical protein H4R19_000591 [Coemansia spiralis]